MGNIENKSVVRYYGMTMNILFYLMHMHGKLETSFYLGVMYLTWMSFLSAADIFLWRDKKVTAGVIGVATTIWVLFELLEYHLLAFVCHLLILGLAIIFLWSNASSFINKYAS